MKNKLYLFISQITLSFFLILLCTNATYAAEQIFTMPSSLSTDTTSYVLLSSSGTTPAVSGFPSDVKIVLSVSNGTLKITTTTGLTAPTGYTTAQWAGAGEIAFEGSQVNVNNALATLAYQGATAGAAALKAAATPTGAAYLKDNSHYYQVVTASLSWTNAKIAAEGKTFNGLTGYLATITTSSENSFIQEKVGAAAWLGANDRETNNVWKWVTGPEGAENNGTGVHFFTQTSGRPIPPSGGGGNAVGGAYSNWEGPYSCGSSCTYYEPNGCFVRGACAGESAEEDYLHIHASGLWNDYKVNEPIGKYVVEYGGLNNETATVYASTNLTIVSTQNPPVLLSSAPADNETSVALDADIVLTFSVAVYVQAGGKVTIKDTNDNLFEDIAVDSTQVTGTGTKTITINPSSSFAQNKGYYVIISSGAFKDSAGQSYAGISDPTALNFSTSPDISYSTTAFTEASANDGSIATSITLTLSNDTYVPTVVSAALITAANVPAGLTANFVRTSATIITATLTGTANSHTHSDSITNLTFTFADGAFTNTATASDVTNYEKNDLKIDFAEAGITYSGGTFTEAAANDGSTTTTITLTLTGDSYAGDVVSANRIISSNVPAGLTANYVRTSDTVITASLSGKATNHASGDSISNMKFTFTNGAFATVTVASTVANYAKNDLVVDFADQPEIAYSPTTFTESSANDGSIGNSITLTLTGDTYVADVVSADLITASNVPAGLTASFVRTGDSVITATLTGNADNHADADGISNLTFTLADGAFTNTTAAANVVNSVKNDLIVDFADPVMPTATTGSASGVTNTGATFNGTVNANNQSSTVTFEYGTTTAYGNTITADQSPVTGTTNTQVNTTVNSLMPATTYHYRLVAVNATGTANGSDRTFTTSETAVTTPTLTTNDITYIQGNSAVSGGNVTDEGGASVVGRGVCWSTSPNPTTGDDCMIENVTGSGMGLFSTTLQLLRTSTTYYVRAFATNSQGTAYGSEKTFKTKIYFFLYAIPAISQSPEIQRLK